MLLSSALIYGEGGAPNLNVPAAADSTAAVGAPGVFDEFGVDPSMEPELVTALRLSREEARARQEAATNPPPAIAPVANESIQPPVAQEVIMQDTDESALLAQALAMSMAGETTNTEAVTQPDAMDEGVNEAEQTKLAMQMSINETKPTHSPATNQNLNVYQDPNFLNSILQGLNGVDPNDERVKNALAGIQKKDDKKEEKKDDKEKKK